MLIVAFNKFLLFDKVDGILGDVFVGDFVEDTAQKNDNLCPRACFEGDEFGVVRIPNAICCEWTSGVQFTSL